MSRLLHGRIADQNNNPLINARVEAWDQDAPDADDLMGVVYTNANGNYELHYRGGHWDPAPHGITTWRPDIYVTASIKNSNGDWMQAAKSKVHANHKLAQDLQIDLTVPISPVMKARTAFQVSQYAFQFPNSFSVSDLIPSIPGLWHMGLCGGMSAGALHRFNHKCQVPTQTTTPEKGTPLYGELLQRQIDTLSGNVLGRIYDWMRSPDVPHPHTPNSIRFMQKAEWRVLQTRIDEGKPALLCLIREEGYVADITKNHQVLAIGYEYDPTPRNLKVEIYDPNDKNGSNYLHLCLSGGRLGARQIDSSGGSRDFRGFFVIETAASEKHYG